MSRRSGASADPGQLLIDWDGATVAPPGALGKETTPAPAPLVLKLKWDFGNESAVRLQTYVEREASTAPGCRAELP